MVELDLIKMSVQQVKDLLKSDRKGVTALEYGLIAAGIAVAIIAAVKTLGNTLSSKFTNIGTSIGT